MKIKQQFEIHDNIYFVFTYYRFMGMEISMR